MSTGSRATQLSKNFETERKDTNRLIYTSATVDQLERFKYDLENRFLQLDDGFDIIELVKGEYAKPIVPNPFGTGTVIDNQVDIDA